MCTGAYAQSSLLRIGTICIWGERSPETGSASALAKCVGPRVGLARPPAILSAFRARRMTLVEAALVADRPRPQSRIVWQSVWAGVTKESFGQHSGESRHRSLGPFRIMIYQGHRGVHALHTTQPKRRRALRPRRIILYCRPGRTRDT